LSGDGLVDPDRVGSCRDDWLLDVVGPRDDAHDAGSGVGEYVSCRADSNFIYLDCRVTLNRLRA
jgi:hypothetical protein